MKDLGLKFYSNDPEIGEVSDASKADFAISRSLLTLEEVRAKYPNGLHRPPEDFKRNTYAQI